jgi:hypothetical protein
MSEPQERLKRKVTCSHCKTQGHTRASCAVAADERQRFFYQRNDDVKVISAALAPYSPEERKSIIFEAFHRSSWDRADLETKKLKAERPNLEALVSGDLEARARWLQDELVALDLALEERHA